MNKIVKIFAITSAVLVLLIGGLLVLLPTLADTQAFRKQLSSQVKQHTGQTLTIEGELSLSVFPWLGIRTDAIQLSQPPSLSTSGDTRQFISVANADIQVKLLPLLFKQQLQMKQIRLNKPTIYFQVDKEGNSSLDGLTRSKSPSSQPTPERADDKTSSEQVLAGLFIAGITLTDGQLIYDNRQNDSHYELTNLNLNTGDLLSGSPVDVSLSAHLSDNNVNQVIIANLNTKATLSLAGQQVAFNKTALSIEQQQETLTLKLGEFLFNGDSQQLSLQQLTILGQTTQFSTKPLNPQITIPQATINLKNESTTPIEFVINENTTGINSTGVITLEDWSQQFMFKGAITSTHIKPAALLPLLEMEYQPSDKNVMKSLTFASDFNGSPEGIALKNIKLTLDDSQLTGDLALVNFASPAYRFDINLDRINLNRYLPASDEKTPATTENASSNMALTAPMGALKTINANGMLRVQQLQADGAKLSDITLKVTSSTGTVVIEPKANAYNGTLEGKLTFIDKGTQSSLTINSQINTVNVEPLLVDTQITDQLSGLATINTDVVITENKEKQTNKGTITLAIQNGALKGIDIKKILDDTQRGIDQLRGKSIDSTAPVSDDTRFTEMTATLLLNNNVLTNNDLSIKAPAFRIGGKGKIDLEKQVVDYTTNVTVVNTNEGQGGENRDNLKGLIIPVAFSGPITQPKYDIDFKALLKANTDKKVDSKKEEAKESLKEKAAEKLGIKTDGEQQQSTDALKEEAKKKLLEKLFR